MASGANPVKAVLFALGANFAIAVTKYIAAAITGSGSMLAEAVHSTADTHSLHVHFADEDICICLLYTSDAADE